jgi:hypothetical protein
MAFVANYTVAQGLDCSSVVITDTSSYSSEAKSTFTYRRLYLYKADGTTIKYPSGSTTAYIDFSFASYPSDQITVTGIDQDYGLRIEMQLGKTVPVSGSIYTKSSVCALTCYTNTALYNVCQIAATNPARIDDPVFYDSWSELQTEKDAAVVAATYGDQLSSDAALKRAKNIINQSILRF